MNGSMLSISNPFTSSRRQAEADKAVLERHRMERETRESTRKDAYLANQEMEETFMDLRPQQPKVLGRTSTAENNKFGFEMDSEDEIDEEEINLGVDKVRERVGRLNLAANGMKSRLDEQNELLGTLGVKVSLHALAITD